MRPVTSHTGCFGQSVWKMRRDLRCVSVRCDEEEGYGLARRGLPSLRWSLRIGLASIIPRPPHETLVRGARICVYVYRVGRDL